jgi:two-component system, chemotaxis family, sensor kinase CheA
MSIDVSQFVQTFLDESFEGLDAMESQLLELRADDVEAINTIFRAAHSIKGGAGTFGFGAVGEFTHGVETLLDEMRGGRRAVTPELVRLLLEAVDCMREMLVAARDGVEADAQRIATVRSAIDASLNEENTAPMPEQAAAGAGGNGAGWHIRFIPEPDVMRTGNDPLRILAALEELGSVQVTCDLAQLPGLEELDPEACLLAWDICLEGPVGREAVTEVFEWVEDQCELHIEPLVSGEVAASVQPSTAVAPHASAGGRSSAGSGVNPPAQTRSGFDRRSGGDRRGAGDRRADTGSIRVNIDKIDALINMVGELVITQSMLGQIGNELVQGGPQVQLEKLRDGLTSLERNTRELQESVMRIRMLPISFAFNRFPRLVHDLSAQLGKQVELRMSGENTELDKTVMEKIGDPLVHLVRNALDHGLEVPEVRLAAGKSPTGTLLLNAYHQGGNIVIEIIDDGAGINREKVLKKAVERGLISEADAAAMPDERVSDLIFQPGFSTAETVSDVSGRGVGMDVVRRNIQDLGGSVEITSRQGQGSRITIRLPLTLAILDGQLVRVGEQIYIIPLVSIIESLQAMPESLNVVAGMAEVYRLREEYLSVIRLHRVFGVRGDSEDLTKGLLVVVEGDGQRAAVFVDELLGQQQVVIKSLETNFRRVDGTSGATILGDGSVALIMDIPGLIRMTNPPAQDAARKRAQIEEAV